MSVSKKLEDCDLVMKGGVASGVVYPKAVGRLAEDYQFRCIGGSSAGAISAVLTAAAEFRRKGGSRDSNPFDDYAEILRANSFKPDELLQPAPGLNSLFDLMKNAVSTGRPTAVKILGLLLWVNRGFVLLALIASFLTVFLVQALEASLSPHKSHFVFEPGLLALSVFSFAFFTVLFLVLRLRYQVMILLPKNEYALCTGLGNGQVGLTDWIHTQIQKISGHKTPLTIGDLKTIKGPDDKDYEIELATITTDLTTRRPYQTPLCSSDEFYFEEAAFRKILPSEIVDYLMKDAQRVEPGQADVPHALYKLKSGDDFPVLLSARMSLAFPLLLSATPLWRKHSLTPASDERFVKCLFSDGGLSSNFPVFMFDKLVPSRVTFGITLGDYDENRHDEKYSVDPYKNGAKHLPAHEIDGLGSFLWAAIATAKDWQDTLQSCVTGFSDRIVEIRLNPSECEGGFHFKMDEDKLEKLGERGEQAVSALLENFDMVKHKKDRAIGLNNATQTAISELVDTRGIDPMEVHKFLQSMANFSKNKLDSGGVAHGGLALKNPSDLRINASLIPKP